jgi:acetyl-CoA carboxylase carboxyltransferase component
MGGKQASETLVGIRIGQEQKLGRELTEKDRKKLLDAVQDRYDKELDPLFAASRLWVDGIVDPTETRKIISTGLSMASSNPEVPRFNPGVIQT